MNRLRDRVKAALPRPVRKVLRALLHYAQRVGRWGIILVQLRGESWRDELKLVASAAAAPFVSLHRLSAWQDPMLLFDATVRVRGIGRFDVRRRSDDLWHVLPWRERAIHRALRERLRRGGTFVDAGANIGIYSVLASRLVGAHGRVVAIEMIPGTARILRRHLHGNGCGNALVVEKALADRAGLIVSAQVPPGRYGQASIAATRDRAGADRVDVETTTIDEVCRDLGTIDLLKMDLEGAETLALRGAADTLPRVRRLIVESLGPDAGDAHRALLGGRFGLRMLGRKDLLAECPGLEEPSCS